MNLDVLTHSGVRVNPDVLMLAGTMHMNKDFSQAPRPTFKRALRRISVISVVISMTTGLAIAEYRISLYVKTVCAEESGADGRHNEP